jgi:hypothetical protein
MGGGLTIGEDKTVVTEKLRKWQLCRDKGIQCLTTKQSTISHRPHEKLIGHWCRATRVHLSLSEVCSSASSIWYIPQSTIGRPESTSQYLGC